MPPSFPSRRAFSLLELLLVISIMGIVAAFVVPAASTIVRGTALNQASQMLTDRLSLARQSAITKNHPIEVRLLQFASPDMPGESVSQQPTWQYRGIQLMEVFESGSLVSFDKVHVLPQGVVMDSTGLSTLLPGGAGTLPVQIPGQSDPPLPGVTPSNSYRFVAFRFLANGSTNLSPSVQWYATLRVLKDPVASGSVMPANFFTLQIDPVSGSMKSFRPSVQ